MVYALCITFGILLLFLIFAAWGMLDKNITKDSVFFRARLTDKFEKEIKKVSPEEQSLYRKVFNKIECSEPRFWDKDWHGISTEISMRNLKIHAKMNNDDDYTCWGITVINNKENSINSITIYTPEGQQKLFNIFSDYAIHKWDMYRKEVEKEKEKEAIKEHRDNIKKANKFLK